MPETTATIGIRRFLVSSFMDELVMNPAGQGEYERWVEEMSLTYYLRSKNSDWLADLNEIIGGVELAESGQQPQTEAVAEAEREIMLSNRTACELLCVWPEDRPDVIGDDNPSTYLYWQKRGKDKWAEDYLADDDWAEPEF